MPYFFNISFQLVPKRLFWTGIETKIILIVSNFVFHFCIQYNKMLKLFIHTNINIDSIMYEK